MGPRHDGTGPSSRDPRSHRVRRLTPSSACSLVRCLPWSWEQRAPSDQRRNGSGCPRFCADAHACAHLIFAHDELIICASHPMRTAPQHRHRDEAQRIGKGIPPCGKIRSCHVKHRQPFMKVARVQCTPSGAHKFQFHFNLKKLSGRCDSRLASLTCDIQVAIERTILT